MIALVVNIIFTVAFFHVIRSAQARNRNVMLVAVVNYLVASPLCFPHVLLPDVASLIPTIAPRPRL